MERCNDAHFKRSSIKDEHHHRYQIAALIAQGRVADCASGIGYGGRIIESLAPVDSYTGIDPSSEAIEYAKQYFKSEKLNYIVGTLEANDLLNNSIDTFLMFETLEHTKDPDIALKGARSKIADDGILVGSVPSSDYELACSEVYGPNPYHLQKFSLQELYSLLKNNFESVEIFGAEFVLGTLFRPILSDNHFQALPRIASGDIQMVDKTPDTVDGSFFFVAGKKESVRSAIKNLGGRLKFLQSIPKVSLDFEEVIPVKAAFDRAEEMIRQRDIALKSQTEMIDMRDDEINSQRLILQEKLKYIEENEKEIVRMKSLISEYGEKLEKQSSLLHSLESSLKSRRFLINKIFEITVGRYK